MLETNNDSDKEYDWKLLEEDIEELSKRLTKDLSEFSTLNKNQFKEYQEEIKKFIDFIKNSEEEIENLYALQDSFDKSVVNFEKMEIEKLLSKISNCIKDDKILDDWVKFTKILTELKKIDCLLTTVYFFSVSILFF